MKRRKRKYTKTVKSLVTPDMWVMVQELKVITGKSKASIIREALSEYEKKVRGE